MVLHARQNERSILLRCLWLYKSRLAMKYVSWGCVIIIFTLSAEGRCVDVGAVPQVVGHLNAHLVDWWLAKRDTLGLRLLEKDKWKGLFNVSLGTQPIFKEMFSQMGLWKPEKVETFQFLCMEHCIMEENEHFIPVTKLSFQWTKSTCLIF